MCGIYGIVGKKNVINDTLIGISNLEYRGYDSAGIAYFNQKTINVIKEVGDISNLKSVIEDINPKSNIAIAHTRWATHGNPSKENAHPFVSCNGDFCLVHNGIIENFEELKPLTDRNFSSSTDSEVILKLIEKYYDGDILTTIHKVCSMLKGSYALAILSKYDLDKIYVVKNTSPCVVSKAKKDTRVCSDINSVGNVEYSYILNNGDIAVLTKNNITVYNKDLQIYTPEKVYCDINYDNNKGSFSHYMRKEIYDIPKTILDTCSVYKDRTTLNNIFKNLDLSKFSSILIIGCGTAYHAGFIGKKLLELSLDIPIKCEIASEFLYSNTYLDKSTLAFFVSQSGETADTISALKIAKSKGATTIAISNVKNSTITFESDYNLYTYAEKEIAVASTKAYIAQISLFYILSSYLNQKTLLDSYDDTLSNIEKIGEDIDIPLLEKLAIEISHDIYQEKDIYMIGRDFDYITALESSLKLKEISYIHSEAYPAGELKHGTISLIENGTFVFAFLTQDALKSKTLNNVMEVISRGGKIITISNNTINIDSVYKNILLPNVNEIYLPIYSAVFMQLVAYHTSLAKNLNPDKPRALAKSVTVE